MEPEPRRVTANGIDFAYLEAGPADGPLALCLHGFPDHAHTYDALRADLAAAGFHTVAPWMRGYAPTSLAPDGNYQVASLALDAVALADALAPGREAVLVGHDWGAMTGYTAVGHAPERFRKLVTIAVPHAGGLAKHIFSHAQLKRSWYQFFFQMPVAEFVLPADDFALIDALWRDWSPGITLDPEFMRALKDTLAAPGSLAAALGYYRAVFGTTPPDPSLSDVQAKYLAPTPVPTLYLHGTDDGVMGAEIVIEAELRPFFPAGLELEMVAGTGHFLHLEKPEVVNPRIVSFLAASSP
jgi:pimeloyl-ACP methyl ester carboxylesterase